MSFAPVGGLIRRNYGGKWDGPVLVLTHRPPRDPEDPEIRFVTYGEAGGPGEVELERVDLAEEIGGSRAPRARESGQQTSLRFGVKR